MSRHSSDPSAPGAERPRLELSGPVLARAFETLVAGTESQGGIERWIDALKLRARMFQQALGGLTGSPGTATGAAALPPDTFRSLCAFMAGVRRRVGPYLEKPDYDGLVEALAALLGAVRDTATTDARIAAFCARFPQDHRHRWVRDLAAEVLHNVDPERYPLMCRWVWDRKSNTGVVREIWFDEAIDRITLEVPDRFGTFLVLREELSQYLTHNGVFRDVIWYVDLLCAKIYADYIAAQGGAYLRTDFSTPSDPMEYTRRLLGLDGVRAGPGGTPGGNPGRTRLKAVDGEAFVVDDATGPAGLMD